MAIQDFKSTYKTIMDDHFPPRLEISFVDGATRQTLVYEKASWLIDGVNKGLRYGENPGQEAALFKLVNGNLLLGEVRSIQPGRYLASDVELLQSGKHPGKTNITDVDNALNILRYLMDTPCAVIVKHNNPCGVAKDATGFGYTGVRGYHPLLAVAAGTGDVLMARLRGGSANTARGAGHFLTETINRVRRAGARGELTVRADSGFYAHAVVTAARKRGVRFSITIRQSASLRRVIEAIP